MKLKMTGHNTTKTSYVTAEELKKVSNGVSTKGYFDSDIDRNDSDDPIVLTIKNTIYINDKLTGQEKKDVEAHERQHFGDFKKLAEKMKTDIERALRNGKDPQIADRVDWLIYDRCQTSAAFHRKTAGYSVEICFAPTSDRPK